MPTYLLKHIDTSLACDIHPTNWTVCEYCTCDTCGSSQRRILYISHFGYKGNAKTHGSLLRIFLKYIYMYIYYLHVLPSLGSLRMKHLPWLMVHRPALWGLYLIVLAQFCSPEQLWQERPGWACDIETQDKYIYIIASEETDYNIHARA